MTPLGPFEKQVMEYLWMQSEPVCVRDVKNGRFAKVPYTTLMTTLDRLYRKGVLDRTKHGRAFFYTTRLKQSELGSAVAADVLRNALVQHGTPVWPLLSSLVKIIGEHDKRLLDELEILVRKQRLAD